MFESILLARHNDNSLSDLFVGLYEGDPVAYVMLAGMIAIVAVVTYLKNKSHQQLARAAQGRD